MLQTTAAVGSGAATGFGGLEQEVELDGIPVRGELPPWLAGSLVRVTPARLDTPDGTIRHWFDGLAMLHRFGFGDGRVSYANRFLRSESFERSERGEGMGLGFATDPCRAIFKRVQTLFSPDFTDNANVNLMRLGERYVAMTETPLLVQLEPRRSPRSSGRTRRRVRSRPRARITTARRARRSTTPRSWARARATACTRRTRRTSSA